LFTVARKRVFDTEWNHLVEFKKPEDHIDWKPFCEYLRAQVPTAEFLFKQYGVWNEMWHIRTVSELHAKLPVDEETVQFMKAAGYDIIIKKGWFGNEPWSLVEEKVSKQVVHERWMHWRKKSEEGLEGLKADLIEF
jgi:hypothetical protein